MRSILTLIAVFLCSLACSGTKDSDPQTTSEAYGLTFDLNQLAERRDTFLMLSVDQQIGTMILESKKEGSSFVIDEITKMPGNNISEYQTVHLNGTDLAMESQKIWGSFGPTGIDYLYTWTGNRMTGHINVTRNDSTQSTPVDTVAAKHTMPRIIPFALVHAMPLADDFQYTTTGFFSLSGSFGDLELKTVGSETVDVRAGVFDCFKIELNTPQIDNVLYVTKAEPRRVVKIDVVGQPMGVPMHFELLKL